LLLLEVAPTRRMAGTLTTQAAASWLIAWVRFSAPALKGGGCRDGEGVGAEQQQHAAPLRTAGMRLRGCTDAAAGAGLVQQCCALAINGRMPCCCCYCCRSRQVVPDCGNPVDVLPAQVSDA
jgi:hypothetical protein